MLILSAWVGIRLYCYSEIDQEIQELTCQTSLQNRKPQMHSSENWQAQE